ATSAKEEAIVKLLTGAGASGNAKPVVVVDANTLQSYAGVYFDQEQSEKVELNYVNAELVYKSEDSFFALEPVDQTMFRPVGDENVKLTFRTHNGKVAGFTYQSGKETSTFKRLEKTEPVVDPESKLATEKRVKVAVPKNWPSFRGPNATGVADDQMPPT